MPAAELDLSCEARTEPVPPKMRALAPTQSPVSPRAKVADLIMQRSISFVHALNARDVTHPWTYASSDYVHHYTAPNGEVGDMTAEETMAFFRGKFAEYPDYKFEIVNTDVHLEPGEKPAYGTVWQTCRVLDGETYGEKERVAIYSWRRETDRFGFERWVWYRQECPTAAAVLPI